MTTESGETVKLTVPAGDELPSRGFDAGEDTYQAPPADGSGVNVIIDPSSERLQKLTPFSAWDGNDIEDALILIKAKGKCTTDHISMAGPWLKYRGHLDNISNNLLIGATNAENDKVNSVYNVLVGEYDTVPNVARAYKVGVAEWKTRCSLSFYVLYHVMSGETKPRQLFICENRRKIFAG